MSDTYILDGREVKSVDLMTWARGSENHDRRIDFTNLGKVRVSTVFLGLDHNFLGKRPHIFETMVFGRFDTLDLYCKRYSTYDEAEDGHIAVVAICNKAIDVHY